MAKCGRITEIYSRVCGYFRPVSNWNRGKKEEFKERKSFKVNTNEYKNRKTGTSS
jgi:ribonucleoside-triphosphate reductase